MNKISKLKVFTATTAVMFPLICTFSTISVGEKNYTSAIIYDEEEVEETTTTTIVTTTTKAETTTTIVTTEPVDEYKHIRNLELLKNNDLSIEELDIFIAKYASYSKLSYDDALQVINDNIDTIENEYESIRGGIMCTLFDYSKDNNILSVYTEDREIREDMTQEEKESIMIEYCDNLCMCNDDKYIVISAFREETGRGISDMCVYNNNYGGIKVYNGEYGRFSTPEFGIYYEVGLINYKLKNIRSEGINDINSVVYQFACRYNPDYADHYSGKILNWVYDVQNDYGDFTNVVSKQKVYNN